MGQDIHAVHGLHHVTAICGPAQENLDFYAGVLGMRLVKRTVNQDDPGTYHLFYADAEGHPGTDLTFFPWANMPPGREGHGTAPEVSLAVLPGALDYWYPRLEQYGTVLEGITTRFGERTLAFRDPHGMQVALVEGSSVASRVFTPWEESSVPVPQQVRGLHGARVLERDREATTSFIAETMGFRLLASEDGWERWAVEDGGSGEWLDVGAAPEARRGAWGVGSIHHLAFRVEDDVEEMAIREQVAVRSHPTQMIDRFWFHSVYFKEPGGVLFELATEGPGFTTDEEVARLGEKLVLPPWLEPRRAGIEAQLPPLTLPGR